MAKAKLEGPKLCRCAIRFFFFFFKQSLLSLVFQVPESPYFNVVISNEDLCRRRTLLMMRMQVKTSMHACFGKFSDEREIRLRLVLSEKVDVFTRLEKTKRDERLGCGAVRRKRPLRKCENHYTVITPCPVQDMDNSTERFAQKKKKKKKLSVRSSSKFPIETHLSWQVDRGPVTCVTKVFAA